MKTLNPSVTSHVLNQFIISNISHEFCRSSEYIQIQFCLIYSPSYQYWLYVLNLWYWQAQHFIGLLITEYYKKDVYFSKEIYSYFWGQILKNPKVCQILIEFRTLINILQNIELYGTLFFTFFFKPKQTQCDWLNLYCEQKQQLMEKISQFQQTKGTQMSFPIILNSLKERENQSEKTLFKNDSQSSDEGPHMPTLPKRIQNNSNLPELDQIKKFLKRGDQLNNQTLKKLKEDKQINQLAKQDRSSASLYKTSRHLDFISLDTSKEKEIKRIYMSHKKTKSKPLFIFPIYKAKKSSQQVQTDAIQPPLMIGSRNSLTIQPNQTSRRYPSFQHHISYNSIEAIQEQFSSKHEKKHETYVSIQQDMQEQKLLPTKQRKNITARAKALSGKHNIDGYIRSMGKTSFQFYNGMNRVNNRYKEYKQQETIFSKTIDTKPLLPLKETLNTFLDAQIKTDQALKTKKEEEIVSKVVLETPQKNPQTKKNEKQLSERFDSSALTKIQKVQSKLNQMQKKIESFKQSMISQPLVPFTFDKNQKQFQHQSSMVPQQSENVSPYPSSRSRQINSRITENLINLIPASPSQKKRPKHQNKEKTSILIQVPSMHQLKVGNIQTTENRIHHPIRQNFNQNQMNWMKSEYHPKHQIFKGVNLLDFHIKKYKNGVFFGEIDEQGRKHGKGIIFYYSGKIYEGQMTKDLKQGKGLEIYPDGSRFKGEFVQGLKQGRGIFEWSNGEIYDGQWEGGRKNGSGMWKGADGQSYIGEWKNGKVEGFGVYVMKNGSRYEGQFKNSLKHGVGTERFNNGETFVGNYQKNRPNGQGEYYWANGDYYKGSFSNGLRHGEGYFKQGKTNIQYRGQYKNDKKCGYGEINYENGLVYVGNFENNYRHGFGQLTQNGSLKYRGYWINDHQVDELQQENQNNNKKPDSKNRKKEVKPILIPIIKEDELQRQQSLPRPLIPARNTVHNHNNNSQSHHHHSPQDSQGYKRACGCNKKH